MSRSRSRRRIVSSSGSRLKSSVAIAGTTKRQTSATKALTSTSMASLRRSVTANATAKKKKKQLKDRSSGETRLRPLCSARLQKVLPHRLPMTTLLSLQFRLACCSSLLFALLLGERVRGNLTIFLKEHDSRSRQIRLNFSSNLIN